MSEFNNKYKIAECMIESVENDFIVMLKDCPNQEPIYLSEIGGIIFKGLQEGLEIECIANQICELYDVTIDDVKNDIIDLIDDLEKVNLLKKI